MKKQHFVINHGTYPFDVFVAIGYSHPEVTALLEKRLGRSLSSEELDDIEMNGEGRTVMLSGGHTILRMRPQKTKALMHATLAHEIFHAVEFLFDRIGLKHHITAGEAFAYQIQHLTEQIYKHL